MILHPLSDRVVAKKAEPAEKTASGILLAGNQNEKPAYAVVESVGPDVKSVKAGDKIIFKESLPFNPSLINFSSVIFFFLYSSSIVPGGLLVIS